MSISRQLNKSRVSANETKNKTKKKSKKEIKNRMREKERERERNASFKRKSNKNMLVQFQSE